MRCSIIAPRQHEIVGHREDGYLAECIRESAHRGPHVVKTPEGRLLAWKDDLGCGCCESEEDDRCTVYWEIQEQDMATLR